jgi:rubredoxin
MPVEITVEKIPGGFRVDGLDLMGGKCGCTSILGCCHSWSKIKRSGNAFSFTAKTTSPDTKDLFQWGYSLKKGDHTVEVTVEDARDKKIFSGFYPPPLEAWVEKGWEVVSRVGEREDFEVWRCATCKWLYKEKDQGVKFTDLPADWKCPVCRASKDAFEKVG